VNNKRQFDQSTARSQNGTKIARKSGGICKDQTISLLQVSRADSTAERSC